MSLMDEKKTLKILFWCLSPILFITFFRLFWVVIGFFYGGLFYLLLGSTAAGIITGLSIVTALVVTILTFHWIYLQYKKHIIGAG